jgi:hypothetical protein
MWMVCHPWTARDCLQQVCGCMDEPMRKGIGVETDFVDGRTRLLQGLDSAGIGRLCYLRSPAAAPHGLGGSVMGGFKVQSLKTCAYASVTSSVGSKGLSKGLTCSVCSCSVLTSAPNSVCVPCRQQARAGQQRECRLGPTSQAPTVRADSLRACLTAALCVSRVLLLSPGGVACLEYFSVFTHLSAACGPQYCDFSDTCCRRNCNI